MTKYLIQFAKWLLKLCKVPDLDIPEEISDVLPTAISLCKDANKKYTSASGGFKRSKVLSELRNILPDKADRFLSLGIEIAYIYYVKGK